MGRAVGRGNNAKTSKVEKSQAGGKTKGQFGLVRDGVRQDPDQTRPVGFSFI